MSDDKRNNHRPTVSIGNTWIVCPSKSHPGHIYYFNTLTREAVWNINEAEIEKARLTTQMLESQSGSKAATCPEPKDNPPIQKTLKNDYHNKFQLREFEKNHQSAHLYERQQPQAGISQTPKLPGAIYSAIPMNDLSAFDFNALNNQINAFNLINTSGVNNPNAWTITRQPFLITPTIPLVNQDQHAVNVSNHQSAFRVNQFNNTEDQHQRFYQDNTIRQEGYFKRCQPLPSNDLRKRLTLKRRLSSSSLHAEESALENIYDQAPPSTVIQKKIADVSAHIVDAASSEKDRMNCNRKGVQEEELTSKLDLTPLRCMGAMNLTQDKWYIVVDLNVLLEEFDFLNYITDSDIHCTLLVPENVMSELKDYIARSNNIPARRIFHSLTLRIESNRASIGQEPIEDYGHSITNPILKTCFSLLEENFHVILLTNDNELLRYKKFIKVNMFTVDEVKTLLNQHRPRILSISSPNGINSILPNQSPSKFTIPSKRTSEKETITKKPTQVGLTIEEPTLVDTIINEPTHTDINSEAELSRKENYRSVQPTLPLKCTLDAAIQTDIVTVINDSNTVINDSNKVINDSNTVINDSNTVINDSNTVINDSNTVINDSNTVTNEVQHNILLESSNKNEAIQSSTNIPSTAGPNLSSKRREIKLKRSIRNQSSGCVQTNEKKPSRWRRKKDSILKVSETTPDSVIAPRDVDINDTTASQTTVNNAKENQLSKITDTQTIHKPDQQILNSGKRVESVESSNNCLSTMIENLNVEKTSTSGGISNTGSNVGTDHVKYKDNHDEPSCSKSNGNKSMVHVDIQSMEESFKTKCEEWVSRFIQIMEEVLAVVLHKEQAFSNSDILPPWTLNEAAQCIGKYCNVPAVKLASSKLSEVLYLLSDRAGKLSLNMTLCQYMEMYSSGVSLLKEVKAITTLHEDIETAEESLQKLLTDINNPHYGSNDSDIDPHEITEVSGILNDSFGSCISQETEKKRGSQQGKNNLRSGLKTLVISTQHEEIENEQSLHKNLIDIESPQNDPNDLDIVPQEITVASGILNESFGSYSSQETESKHGSQHGKYNLRSRLKRPKLRSSADYGALSSSPEIQLQKRSLFEYMGTEQLPSSPVKVIRNMDVKTSFFSSLNLKSNSSFIKTTELPSKPEESDGRGNITFSSGNLNNESDTSLVNGPKSISTINIVRNFTKCAKFEEKLRNKLDGNAYEIHDEDLDYEDDYEYTSAEYVSDDFLYEDDNDAVQSDPNITHLSEFLDSNMAENFVASSPKPVDPPLAAKNNNTFKFMIHLILQEVRNALNEVKVLCDKCYAELRNPQLPALQRNELKHQIEKACLHVNGLCISLESMLNRDSNAPTDNIKTAVKKAGLEISDIDEDLLIKYWDTIANCKKNAEVFLFTIKEIIAAFKTK